MKEILLLFSISIASLGFSQKKIIPQIGKKNSFSEFEYEYWSNSIKIFNSLNNSTINYEKLNLSQQTAIDSLEQGYGPITEGTGCSWYCGGGPYKITSSSVLKSKKIYSEQNIHDFNLLTAWVPKSKNGINEEVSFYFKPKSPRINAITIYNGYIKTKKLWIENSRAKEIILYINKKVIGVLQLEDTSSSQTFKIPLSHTQKENKDIVITLKIKSFYPGSKHQDLVISEINFDGIDVH